MYASTQTPTLTTQPTLQVTPTTASISVLFFDRTQEGYDIQKETCGKERYDVHMVETHNVEVRMKDVVKVMKDMMVVHRKVDMKDTVAVHKVDICCINNHLHK